MSLQRTIPTTIHGRYLVDLPDSTEPHLLLVGFHGYAEQAGVQLDRLRDVRDSAAWSLVSIQGLHRFYRSGGEVLAASWMTREDRELMIADNVAYVDRVIDTIADEGGPLTLLVYAGFSQGASMAYRAAALGTHRGSGIIALGGDIPPELTVDALARIPRALVGRNADDRFYKTETRESDVERLRAAGVDVTVVDLDGGHQWTPAFSRAASAWIRTLA
jgi:predicted esterase